MDEDVAGLAMIRAKGGFVIACAQSLGGLDAVLGQRDREALLANFNSVFFFAARENVLDEFAFLTMGFRTVESKRILPDIDEGDLQLMGRQHTKLSQPICPPGELARLGQHHAYVKLANSTITEKPVWLEPQYFTSNKPAAASTATPALDSLAEAVQRLRSARPPGDPSTEIASFQLHMHRRGHKLFFTQAAIAAAWQICAPEASPATIMPWTQRLAIAGVDSLPPCWQIGFLGWCKSHAQEASLIRSVTVLSGILWPKLTGPATRAQSYSNTVAENINCALFPSLYRRLRRREIALLRIHRPDLREELQRQQP